MAKGFGFLDNGSGPEGIFAALHSYLVYCAHVGIYNEVHPILHKLLRYLGKGSGQMAAITSSQIQERVKTHIDVEKKPGSGDDFLAQVLQKHEEDPESFTMREPERDSLAPPKEPQTLQKLRSELDMMASEGQISDPITFQNAQKVPYPEAVIKEALRMHPATGLPLGRVVPKGGATITGKYIPEGTVVGINLWVAHNNKSVFVGEVATVRSERWLEDEERARMMDNYYIPVNNSFGTRVRSSLRTLHFGHGSRTCIGKDISLMDISVLIPQLVREFDFSLANPEAELECENI